MPRADWQFIGSMKFPLPSLAEQHAIVRYLAHVDRRIQRYIEAKEKLIALLQEARQSIIQRAVTRGLDPDVSLKPSGADWLGDVPAHWEVRRLRYLIDGDLTYGANAAAEYDDSTWPRYLRITTSLRMVLYETILSALFPPNGQRLSGTVRRSTIGA